MIVRNISCLLSLTLLCACGPCATKTGSELEACEAEDAAAEEKPTCPSRPGVLTIADPGEVPSEAHDLGTLGSASVCNSVNSTDPKDYFTFKLLENSDVSITTTDTTTAVGLLFGVDANNNGLLDPEETIESGRIGNAAPLGAFTYRFPKTQRIFIVMSPSLVAGSSYVLNVTATPGAASPETDPGSQPAQAVPFENALSGYVGAFDADDYLSFRVTQRSKVTLTMSALSGASTLGIQTIRDANGNGINDSGEMVPILWGDFREGAGVASDLEPGQYFVRVSGGGPGALYTINVAQQPL
jgi:hypothetical protein